MVSGLEVSPARWAQTSPARAAPAQRALLVVQGGLVPAARSRLDSEMRFPGPLAVQGDVWQLRLE